MRRRSSLPDTLRVPHPERLDPAHPRHAQIVALHTAALDAGDAFYIDPASGLWVMTAAKLWERPCCNNGCRHCPWLDLEARLDGGHGSDLRP